MTRRAIPGGADLDGLVTSMEVEVAALTECFVSPGWRLRFPAAELPALHYTLSGNGQIGLEGAPVTALRPHTLVIMPRDRPFHIEGAVANSTAPFRTREAALLQVSGSNAIQTFRAGAGDPSVSVVCGYFRAWYGLSIDLFATLREPIVEQFADFDHLAYNLKAVLGELRAPKVGMKAMTAAVLKQVMVTILRRSLLSAETWTERFIMLSDPQVARAFADMVEMPGAPHSVRSLAQAAGLSRSVFMERFQRAFGRPPMLVLRELRMRYAAKLLETQALTIDQVARAVGYNSRSSFSRAFHQAHGREPSASRPEHV